MKAFRESLALLPGLAMTFSGSDIQVMLAGNGGLATH